jgi:hypothetical protein
MAIVFKKLAFGYSNKNVAHADIPIKTTTIIVLDNVRFGNILVQRFWLMQNK